MRMLAAALAAVLVHESGHIIAATALGAGLRRGRRFFGLSIKLDGTERIGYGAEAVIYAAGAAANLASLLLPRMGQEFYACSLGAAIFNLVPLSGSDGSGIVGAAVSYFWSVRASKRVTDALSLAFAAAIWLYAVSLNLSGRGSLALLLAVTVMLLSSLR